MVRGLGAALSRREFEALGAAVTKVVGNDASLQVEVLRVEPGGKGRGARAPTSDGLLKRGPATITSLFEAIGAESGDVVVFGVGSDPLPLLTALGHVRLIAAAGCQLVGVPLTPAPGCLAPAPPLDEPLSGLRLSPRELQDIFGMRASKSEPVPRLAPARGPRVADMFWVYGFPMFEASADGSLCAVHHPFSAPLGGADGLAELTLAAPALESSSPEARAAARSRLVTLCGDTYDLVCHGVELGGGSARIADAGAQRVVLDSVLRVPQSARAGFSALLAGLDAGAPPHAGAALGLDRLVATLLGARTAPSLRDVIAFPKSAAGNDLLTGAPTPASPAQLADVGLQVR